MVQSDHVPYGTGKHQRNDERSGLHRRKLVHRKPHLFSRNVGRELFSYLYSAIHILSIIQGMVPGRSLITQTYPEKKGGTETFVGSILSVRRHWRVSPSAGSSLAWFSPSGRGFRSTIADRPQRSFPADPIHKSCPGRPITSAVVHFFSHTSQEAHSPTDRATSRGKDAGDLRTPDARSASRQHEPVRVR